ncbi:MAG: hypothetical protein AAGA80_11155 [Cyanobacteria bacterium P01_F01_bin.143]
MKVNHKVILNLIGQLLFTTSIVVNSNSASAFNLSFGSINFDGFTGSGFQSTPTTGQLDSDDWAISGFSDGSFNFGGTGTSGDFARGTSDGGVITGGIYSFDVGGGNSTLGVQPTGGDFTPGAITLKLTNDTSNTIVELAISYSVYVYNDITRSNSFNFSYSDDDINYTSVPSLDLASLEAADNIPSWVENSRNTTLTGLNIASGSDFYLRWEGDDISGSQNRDQFALDDITFTPVPWEFSPSLGLVCVGMIWLISFLYKRSRFRRDLSKKN